MLRDPGMAAASLADAQSEDIAAANNTAGAMMDGRIEFCDLQAD